MTSGSGNAAGKSIVRSIRLTFRCLGRVSKPCHSRLSAAALAGIVVTLAAATGAAAVAQAAHSARTVRVGVYQNKPKVFVDEKGRASGLFVELLLAVAQKEGWTLSFVPCEWNECLRALESGQLDLMPDVAYSHERARRYGFLRTPVFESWSQLYCPSDAILRGWEDLAGKRVALLRGSIQQKAFPQMAAGLGVDVRLVPTDSLEKAFQTVRDGDADVAIANHFFGDYFHRQYGLVRTPIVFQAAQLHYAAAKGHNLDLLEAIDRHLDRWRGEPNSVYYATLGRWMDRPPLRVIPQRILWIIGVGFGMLLLAGGMILLLRAQVRKRTRHLLRANRKLARTEAALRKSEAILNRTERLSRVGGWEWDVQQKTMTWTEETYRIHGLSRREVRAGSPEHIAKSLACYEPEARDAVRKAFDECCERGVSYDLELPLHTASGPPRWVRTMAEAVRDPQGKILKVVGNIIDVTDRKLAEQDRRALEEQLRRSHKLEAVGRLAGGVAHDFNNLLTVILNCSELALATVKAGDPIREDLTEVLKAGQRAAAVTRQLLAFSRAQVLEPEPIDLNQITIELEKMLRRIVGEDIELRLKLASDLGLTLADTSQLEQVIVNLVVNARDAMPAGGTLTIETTELDLDEKACSQQVDLTPGGYVVLCVTDSGCGMDERTRAHAFEPFFTTKERGKGTGLGLSTVFGIVKQSGGHVAIDSAPGRGTVVKVYLPRTTSHAIAPTVSHAPISQPGGAETVLVVEDEETVGNLAAQMLRSVGYTVLVASSAEQGLELCKTHPGQIHLLLTDVIMPRMSGTALAERVAPSRPEMKVLFMSGYPDQAITERGSLRPGIRFIGKPFTARTLTRKVRETLDGQVPSPP